MKIPFRELQHCNSATAVYNTKNKSMIYLHISIIIRTFALYLKNTSHRQKSRRKRSGRAAKTERKANENGERKKVEKLKRRKVEKLKS